MSQPSLNLFPMFNIMIALVGVLVFLLNSVIALSLGVDKSITLVPETPIMGAEKERIPVYWEWDGYALTQHPENRSHTFPTRIESADSYAEAYAYIDKTIAGTWVADVLYALTHDQKDKFLIILIRPGGFENFDWLRGYLEQRGVDFGYEPVNEEWKLRIRRPRRAPS